MNRPIATHYRDISAAAILAVAMTFVALPAVAQDDAPAAEAAAASKEMTTSDTIPTIFRDSYTVTVKGKAQANGTFTMTFRPFQEDTTKFTVNVAAGMSAKQIAFDIAKELTIATGPRFKVKQSGSKVSVKKANKKKSPTLVVELVSQKLTGVSIMIGK